MQNLNRPRAVVFENHCRKTINKMVGKAERSRAAFRPHFKTHQSHRIGRWFADEGVSGITVSTPQMATYFAQDGWDDITIAFPFYRQQLSEINQLSDNCTIRLFVQNTDDTKYLDSSLKNPVELMIEIDAGYNRSGLSYLEKETIDDLVRSMNTASNVIFKGFYSHDGGTYHVHGKEAVRQTIERDLKAFIDLHDRYPNVEYGLGDTPSSSLLDDLSPSTELSPGNLIFYDLMQIEIGSCSYDDLGMLIQVPVVQEKPDDDQCIIHGGAVHFSKERLNINGKDCYGQPVLVSKNGSIQKIDGTSLIALSQEHGTVSGLKALKRSINTDRLTELWICPVHSCLAANLFEEYTTPAGEIIEKRVLS